ncbi:ubiquinol-cytochrome C reductase hinge protein-domain-containing protein [Lineolata rhizophorae]|uniref:Cytochrome b-c1 complex subunit 6, mitochondrial n=1 Tax=Lineolata rhizophorae TaxID=578093 RepID=A0A6A6PAL9_9PEZI|nr:ubiquinol-cytochrome C reductase hinge protein-domain-containing protein [Lineolata rhizophorae]
MGLSSFFSDVFSTFSVQDVHAEAPEEKEPEGGEEEATKDEAEEEPAEEEEEEEEEEEPVDPKPELEEACANSAQCHGPKHHYDDCVERVTGKIEADGKTDEDCVEEFFHLSHCATSCAAPKLWRQLK